MRHFIDTTDMTIAEWDKVLSLAEDIRNNPLKYAEVCRHKKLATLFFEPSTRTRLSFEAAMLDLGGSVIGFSDSANSSTAKGESLSDTIRTVGCYADIIAMRHQKEGSALAAGFTSTVPIINAGDGGHSHPTQTLTDLLTIRTEKGRLEDLTIGICGDLKFGRTVHSLIKMMSNYKNVRFVLISPEELRLPGYMIDTVLKAKNIPYTEVYNMEAAIPELDILYMTRVQKERFFNEADYIRLKDTFILDNAKLTNAKKDLLIMHPLPRVNEIAIEVDADPRAGYFRQVANGKFARMALIMTLLQWKEEAGK